MFTALVQIYKKDFLKFFVAFVLNIEHTNESTWTKSICKFIKINFIMFKF